MVSRASIALFLAITLACGGLDLGSSDLDDVTEAEAQAAGFTPPPGSEHISVKHRQTLDATVVYMQVSLDPTEIATLRADLATRATQTDQSLPIAGWPDFSAIILPDGGPPPWWSPSGETWLYERPATPASSVRVGNVWTVDEPTGVVCLQSFQTQ